MNTSPEQIPDRVLEDLGIDRRNIRKRFGQWIVTDDGLFCLDPPYLVPWRDLANTDYPVEEHVANKTWLIEEDFTATIEYAKTLPQWSEFRIDPT